jgi:hypothetical protein
MLFGAFRPQIYKGNQKVTGSQDDDFVGVLKKNIPIKLALMGEAALKINKLFLTLSVRIWT